MAFRFIYVPAPGSRGRKILFGVAGVICIVIVGLFVAHFFAGPVIKSQVVKAMNSKLKGYHTQVTGANLRLLDGNLTLTGITLVQDAHPNPPVAYIPKLVAHIEWGHIFTGHVVADFLISRPRFHIDLIQLREEAQSKVPISKQGWQDALQSIYPFKINRFKIEDGNIMYVDVDPNRPLYLSHLDLEAGNIRNIEAPNKTYPSTLFADAIVFGQGHMTLSGNANFLAKPFAGIWVRYWIKNLPLDHFDPVIRRANFNVQNGILDSQGALQYAPWTEQVEVYDATIHKIKLDYIHKAATAGKEQRHVQEVKQTAKQVNNKPKLQLRIDKVTIEHSDVSYTDEAKQPNYRLYMADFMISATNFTNHFYNGPAKVDAHGLFMGSGDSSFNGTFRSEAQGPDFSINLAIKHTELRSLNDLLRAYGKFDVAKGTFSLYMQASVKEGEMRGYVKPMFGDVQVYSHEKDKNKPILNQAYEAVVGAVAHLLKNEKTNKIATQVDISGPLKNPNVSTWQALVELLHNAFIKAILPGFDQQVGRVNRSAGG